MTLRTKLIAFWAILVLALVGVFALMARDFCALADLDLQRRAIELKVGNTLSELRTDCEFAFLSGDDEAVQALFDRYRSDPDFAAGFISDEMGKLRARVGNAERLAEQVLDLPRQKASALGDSWLGGVEDFDPAGLTFGSIAVAYSLERLQAARRRVVLFVLVALVAAALAIAASVVFSNSVTRPISALTHAANQVTSGELEVTLALQQSRGDELGAMTEAFARMLGQLRHLVTQIAATAARVDGAAARILVTSRQLETGAAEQSISTEATRATMDGLLAGSADIETVSSTVLGNAEMTHENSAKVAQSIATLTVHIDRIAETLEVIKDVAHKSDLLALYAALEGISCGEHGYGFSRVAEQMQGLADSVTGSVRDIRALTEDIRRATAAAVSDTSEATDLAAETARTARQINMVIRDQNAATRQATAAMDTVAAVALETAAGGKSTAQALGEFRALSEKLLRSVEVFRRP